MTNREFEIRSFWGENYKKITFVGVGKVAKSGACLNHLTELNRFFPQISAMSILKLLFAC